LLTIESAYPEWKILILAVIALVISSTATLATPMYFGKIIGYCDNDDAKRSELNYLAITLLVIFAVGGITTVVNKSFPIDVMLFDNFMNFMAASRISVHPGW
jgi:ABC-type multidrug transport system fused ATPase/permease subunit